MPRKKKKKFIPKQGATLNEKDAQVVGETLHDLAEQLGGELTASTVVEAAKPKRSKLHKFFEWDDAKAGAKYRESQARSLMRSVCEVIIVDGEEKEQRSIINVRNADNKSVYVTLSTVMETPDYLQQLIDEAKHHIDRLNDLLGLLMSELRSSYQDRAKKMKKYKRKSKRR